eukprot:GHVT01100393.1.p1 GENE.GHVT01100393.1~~GHVT01100393.1.p1  ORF type:complete len:110 (+),score=5.02 GHVT01100393.1:819-1148(+)
MSNPVERKAPPGPVTSAPSYYVVAGSTCTINAEPFDAPAETGSVSQNIVFRTSGKGVRIIVERNYEPAPKVPLLVTRDANGNVYEEPIPDHVVRVFPGSHLAPPSCGKS